MKSNYCFNERLSGLMLENKKNEKDLSAAIGVSPEMIYEWKRRNTSLKLPHLISAADYFKCTLDYITGRSEDTSVVASKAVLPPLYLQIQKVLKENRTTVYMLDKQHIVSENCFYTWSKGTVPQTLSLIKLADYFDITLDYLVGREN